MAYTQSLHMFHSQRTPINHQVAPAAQLSQPTAPYAQAAFDELIDADQNQYTALPTIDPSCKEFAKLTVVGNRMSTTGANEQSASPEGSPRTEQKGYRFIPPMCLKHFPRPTAPPRSDSCPSVLQERHEV